MAMQRGSVNRLQDLAEIYPWMKDMVEGKSGTPAVKVVVRSPSKRYSSKQMKIVKRGT